MTTAVKTNTTDEMPRSKPEKGMTGAEFKRLLGASGVTQRDLAKELGVHHVTLSRWAGGKSTITVPVAYAIRAAISKLGSKKK